MSVLPDQELSVNKLKEITLFSRRENLEKHTSFAGECQEYEAIKRGDLEHIEELVQRIPDGTPGILAKENLRNKKNFFIASITLFNRAAIEGGLQEETAYAMSDSYIQTMEQCTAAEQISQLRLKAALDYTRQIKELHKKKYSPAIEQAIKYIHMHIHTKLTLELTAKAINISPSYLSRLFKKEMNCSFVDYVQKQRINAACDMLLYSNYSDSQISQYLSFSTQSYFVRIFRKHVGMTPGAYRKEMHRKRLW